METNTHSNGWFWGEGWSRFGIFSVIGGFLILAAHGLFPQSGWLIAIFAVLLMGVFAYSEWWYKQGREDRLGDDLYYLGLTYTLCSVVHALYSFTGATNIDKLVSDFSVALLTTLVGIVGRVLLYEKHGDRKAPAEIDDSMGRLRTEIEGAVQQTQEFRNGLALNLQQASDAALQNVSAAFASFSASAKEMNEATKAMNDALKRGATTFDKSFGRIGDASDALSVRVTELVGGTTAFASLSEALNAEVGAMHASVEEHAKALTLNLEAQNENTHRIQTDLGSLSTPISLLAGSIDEMRQQVNAAKNEFTAAQLKTTMADAREAAEHLGRNLRSVANLVSTDSVEPGLSVLKAFALALSELTAKMDDCTGKLPHLGEQPEREPQVQHQLNPSSITEPSINARWSTSLLQRGSSSNPLDNIQEENPRGDSSTREAKSRSWWSWRRD